MLKTEQTCQELFPVSNLTIEEHHSFAVGPDAILVHNTGGCGGEKVPGQLNISSKQFGEKVSRRARDLKLDPSDPRVRYQLRSRIQRIFENADEVRSGMFRGQGPNGSEGPVLFFRRGNDVVVTTPAGDFVTLLIDGIKNKRFNNATPIQ
ncbi:hypothetical protein [Planctomicrobium sp. SH664]|uniref:hypothetical protein n=1 Tax=Planctomicrobium sp. SH664 TaxID=3448125 RepID=UPI003F5B59CE